MIEPVAPMLQNLRSNRSLAALRASVILMLGLLAGTSGLAQQASMESIVDAGHKESRSWVDVNNDGRDDYCVLGGSSADRLDCYLSTGAGFSTTRTVFSVGAGVSIFRPHWVDVNGDGQIDLCRTPPIGGGPSGPINCRLGPGFSSGFSLTIPLAYTEMYGDGTPTYHPGLYAQEDLFFPDVNSDGRADACYIFGDHQTPWEMRCHLSTGTGFAPLTAAWTRAGVPRAPTYWPQGFHDFDGDGFPDFCIVESGGTLRCTFGGQSGFSSRPDVRSTSLGNQVKEGAAFIDINGDGKTDYCRITGNTGAQSLSCRLSNGRTWETAERSTASVIAAGHAAARYWVDINGDGLPDFCRAVGPNPLAGNGSTNGSSNFWCRLSMGGEGPGGLFGIEDVALNTDLAIGAVNFGRADGGRGFCDPWGTGIQTFCRATYRQTSTGQYCVQDPERGTEYCYPTYANTHGILAGISDVVQARQGMLSSYTDGLGAETRVTYLPMTSSQVYQRSTLGSDWPRVQVALPRANVVFESRAWLIGIGTTTLTGNARYFYKDLRLDRDTGSRGFRERWMLSEGSNTLEHIVYFQGLGPTVDPSSVANSPLEIGQVREQKRYGLDTGKITPSTNPTLSNARQKLLAGIIEKATTAGAMKTTPTSPPSTIDPFMLLQRSLNTLGNTSPVVNPRVRFPVASQVQTWDWNGSTAVELPAASSSTVMDDVGNITSLVQTTTQGSLVWRKTTTNEYGQDSRPNWILGRLTKSRVVSEAPSADSQIALFPRSYGTSGGTNPSPNLISSTAPAIVPLAAPSFSNTQVGQTGTATATLTNNSASNLVLTVPTAASVSGTDFSFDSTNCGASLGVNISCTVTLRFSPTAATTRTGKIKIDTGLGLRTASFSATSLATLSVATLTSAAPNLGPVWYGSAAPSATVMFRNDGNTSMSLTGLSGLSTFFQLGTNTCTGVAPGSSCSMVITMPTSTAGTGSSTVTTAGATTNATFGVNGTVYSAVSRWSVTTLLFGDVTVGQSSTQNVTLYNDGYGAAINWAGALANLPAGFSANTSACSSVAPAGSCTASITFAPTAVQAYSGSSVHPSNISYAGNTLSVFGNGLAAYTSLTAEPSSISFGTLAKDRESPSTPVVIRNTGSVAASGLSYAISYTSGSYSVGGYNFAVGNCPASGGSLAPGASCTGYVKYYSLCTGGSRNGKLTVSGVNFNSVVTTLFAGTSTSGYCY